LAVTGEIPDVRTAPAKLAVVHPTVAQLPIAVVHAKNRKIKWEHGVQVLVNLPRKIPTTASGGKR